MRPPGETADQSEPCAGRNPPANPPPGKISTDLLLPARSTARATVLYAGGFANTELSEVWGVSKGRVVHAFLPWSLKVVALYRYDRARFYRMLDELDATLFVDSDGHIVKLPAERRGG